MSGPGRPIRVVMIGGGYVTLHATRALRGAVRRGAATVTVLSADDHHSFHGFTGEVLAGLLPLDVTRTPLRDVLPGADIRHARVTGVDLRTRTVEAVSLTGDRASLRIRYDQLVLAAGGTEPASSVPGLTDHGFLLRRRGDLAALVDHLAARRVAGDRRPVVVIGGGLAGVEQAAAIAERALACGIGQPVELIHRGSTLLPELAGRPRLVRRATQELARLGVHVRLSTEVVAVGDGVATVADGTTLAASAVLATNGQRPVWLPGTEPLARDDRDRVVTSRELRAAPGVWAGGDIASVRHVASGEPVPANALWAIKAGRHIGRSIRREIAGRTVRPFRYLGLGLGASFGVGRGIAELYRVPLTGWVAWASRFAFFLCFMPQRQRAARAVRDLGRVWRRPDRRYGPTSSEVPAVIRSCNVG